MHTFSMAPLFRQSVAFDRFNDLVEAVLRNDSSSTYPPCNIEKHGENNYRIVIAMAGFAESDLDLQVEQHVLTVTGNKRDQAEGAAKVTYLHQGIAQRSFKRSFSLAEHVEVKSASLVNGLLSIELERVVPEEIKPRRIAIGQCEKSDVLN